MHECPCGSGLIYLAHCGRLHREGAGLGVSAEQLMRARYSAYVLGRPDFLLETWHPDTRPESVGFDAELVWLGLDVISTRAGGALDASGTVEFRARFRRGAGGSAQVSELHEVSTFTRVDGYWVYVDGE